MDNFEQHLLQKINEYINRKENNSEQNIIWALDCVLDEYIDCLSEYRKHKVC